MGSLQQLPYIKAIRFIISRLKRWWRQTMGINGILYPYDKKIYWYIPVRPGNTIKLFMGKIAVQSNLIEQASIYIIE